MRGGGEIPISYTETAGGESRLDRDIHKQTWNAAAGNSVCVNHDNNLRVGIST